MRRPLLMGLVLALLLSAAGYTGYLIAKSSYKSQIITLQNKLDRVASTPSAKPQSQDSQEVSYYVVLKEFKVRFPLANNSMQLGFVFNNDTYYFDSDGLTDTATKLDPANKCIARPGYGPLGYLSRTSQIPIDTSTDKPQGLMAHVGGYYYYYYAPSEACSTNSQIIAAENDQMNIISAAFKQLIVAN